MERCRIVHIVVTLRIFAEYCCISQLRSVRRPVHRVVCIQCVDVMILYRPCNGLHSDVVGYVSHLSSLSLMECTLYMYGSCPVIHCITTMCLARILQSLCMRVRIMFLVVCLVCYAPSYGNCEIQRVNDMASYWVSADTPAARLLTASCCAP